MYLGSKNPLMDRYNILHIGCRHDVITHASFGEDRLSSFGVAMGRIFAFPIDLLRGHYITIISKHGKIMDIIQNAKFYRVT